MRLRSRESGCAGLCSKCLKKLLIRCGLKLEVACGEGVAEVQVAGLEAFAEPADALGG